GEEDELGGGAEIVEEMLERLRQEAVGAEHNADHQAGQAADQEPEPDLAAGDAEVPVEVTLEQNVLGGARDDQERRHHVAEQEARGRGGLPHDQDGDDDGDAELRDPAQARKADRRVRQLTGLSHRSTRSVAMKKRTLTRITKQIGAWVPARSWGPASSLMSWPSPPKLIRNSTPTMLMRAKIMPSLMPTKIDGSAAGNRIFQ